MRKDTNYFSEIGNFFKGNDATSAINAVNDVISSLKMTEKRLFEEKSKRNCKFTQLQILQLLLLFPCFMIKNAFNYSASSLYQIAECGKDVFYRFLSKENHDWRKILMVITSQLWRNAQASSERDIKNPVCLMVDDTDYPKQGMHAEMIGKVFSHVEHKMILGFKGLFLGITDGVTQMLLDFCLVGEKGKNGTYNLKQKQLDARFSKERDADSHTATRIKEYDTSKITLMIEMIKRVIAKKIHFDYILADSWFACAEVIKFVSSRHIKCHYLGMIKMGNTKYRYNNKEYTAKALISLFDHPKKGRKHSRRLGCHYITVDVVFAGRKVRLFFTKRNKHADWNALITTNTKLEFLEAYRIYSMRWSLEVVFKDSKGNLGLGKYQMRNFASQIACTAITAMQYNLLATAKRFASYETIGGLFREVTKNAVEITITERIWGVITEIVNTIALCFEIEDEQIFDALIHRSDKLKKFMQIYEQKMVI